VPLCCSLLPVTKWVLPPVRRQPQGLAQSDGGLVAKIFFVGEAIGSRATTSYIQ
jgi:hypothetical protein